MADCGIDPVQHKPVTNGTAHDFTPTAARRIPRVYRLYPSSRGESWEKMSGEQAPHKMQVHVNRDVSSLSSLEFKLHSSKDRKAEARGWGIEQGVIREADKGELTLQRSITMASGQVEMVDAWEVFRSHLQASREGKFRWDNKALVKEYADSYRCCKGHLIALTDILITTAGNARCSEVLDYWRDGKSYGVECNGIIVICDEAGKDLEINTWNAICAAGSQVKGVFLFGDGKQLKPVNTSQDGKSQTNIFRERMDMPLSARLIGEGHSYTSLKEQQRMHPCLSKFPNSEFYNGELRDGPRVKGDLDADCAKVLHTIVAKSFRKQKDADSYIASASDEQARHHYVEIAGVKEAHPRTGSKVVTAHVNVFFKHIFPDLQAHFGKETEKKLMIICAYSYALRQYKDQIFQLQHDQKLPASHYPKMVEAKDLDGDQKNPRILTIDSAQGQESFMVVMDGSFQHRDRMGFMTDRGRCNVAMTRAKGVFWILGGALGGYDSRNTSEPLSPFTKLKKEMDKLGHVHKLSMDSGKGRESDSRVE